MKAKLPVWLWLFAVFALAINLRSPLVAVSPVVNLIQQDLQVSGAFIGLLAALPILCFSLFSPFVSRLSQRFGMENLLLGSIILLAIGIVLRSALPTASALLMGTLLLSFAITIGNVLLPALAKRSLPNRIGLVITVYSISMALSATVASAISVPIAQHFNWQVSLGVWVLAALLAFGVWTYIRKHSAQQIVVQHGVQANVWRLPAAWIISLFFAMQSLAFYTTMNFMPSVLLEKGISQVAAGNYGSLFLATGLFSTTFISWLFERSKRKSALTVFFSSLFLLGVVGIWLANESSMWLWVSLAGVGTSVFSIGLMILPMRTENAEQATQLSGMVQAVGYGIAALGPFCVGLIYDVFHSWTQAMSLIVLILVIQTLLSFFVAKPKLITEK